jgi:hypothetical protein
MARKIFGEFIEFFLKCLNPLKNSNQIQLCLVSSIFNSNFVGNYLPHAKAYKFLDLGNIVVSNFKV